MDDDERSPESEERPRLKVTDRRKFAADGTPRSSVPADAGTAGEGDDPPAATDTAPRQVDAAAAAAAPVAGNREDTAPTDTPAPDNVAKDKPRIAAPQPSIVDLPRDFSAFVEGMYLEAMLYLGALPDPRGGEVMEDFELARYKIDLLSMIQAKTQGNLTDDEKQQLDEVLYQLRTVYLQKTKAVDS